MWKQGGKEGGELSFSVVFLGQVGTIVLGFEKKNIKKILNVDSDICEMVMGRCLDI